MKGYILNPDTGGPEILVITNSASPPAAFTHVLRLRGDNTATTSSDALDLTAGRWEGQPLSGKVMANVQGIGLG